MDIKLDLNAELIQQQIVKAIIESSVGKEMESAINELLVRKNSWTDTVVKDSVKKVIEKIIYTEATKMVEEHKEVIRQNVEQLFTEELFNKMCTKMFDHLINNVKY